MDPKQPSTPAASEAAGVQAAFNLLHPGVQRQLWKIGWTKLRPLQVDAIKRIMQTQHHLVLSAATASGKTEAAFLPILSKIAGEPTGSVRAMYVGPLKALINDQFGRVEDLCEYLDVPVHRWHGDVGASAKANLVKSPGGVLLITPESLESLFINRSPHLRGLFGGLRFVVIDELHSFLDNERGLHLRSLLHRVRRVLDDGQTYRCIGLSATIGDPAVAQQYIEPDCPANVQIVKDHSGQKEIKLRIHGYRFTDPPDEPQADDPEATQENEGPPEEMQRMAGDIIAHCGGHANLIFANAKTDVEEFADLCKQKAAGKGLRAEFLVHHGSLSREIREDTESTMKSGVTATTFCSSTLEMGIDIGSVHMVGQIGAPWSASSLTQRMGRSGRKDGEARILRMYMRCRQPDPDDDIFRKLHLGLVQAIAVTELMLAKWVEPADPATCDLSTMTQQVISVIAETGGIRADRLYERLCTGGAFRAIDKRLFADLLRCLASQDVLEQMAESDLILGLAGERIRKDKSFYAVFQAAEEYAVLHDGRLLGTLECIPQVEEHLVFAGRRWQVVSIDDERMELHVKPAAGWKPPSFKGEGGEIHPKIRQQMREVLVGNKPYVYLDSEAQALLADARHAAAMIHMFDHVLLPLGPQRTAWMTWMGTRIQQTLRAMFKMIAVEAEDDGIALVFAMPAEQVRQAATTCLANVRDPETIAGHIPVRRRRKYDVLLTEELLDTGIARDCLDVGGALAALRSLEHGEESRG